MAKKFLYLFLSWKLFLFLVAIVAFFVLPLNRGPWLGKLLVDQLPYTVWSWGNFDGTHYLYIAMHGYNYPNFAFFPLYPVLTSALGRVIEYYYFQAGLLVSNIAFFLSIFVLFKITLLDFNKMIAERTVLFLFVFPVSYYYTAAYADSLYLLLATTSFYFARKSNWKYAGIFGYFASLTRLVGLFLLPALLIEWFLQNKNTKTSLKQKLQRFRKQRSTFLFMIPLGMVSYMLYLQLFYGDFLLFQKSMGHWNQNAIIFPLQVVYRYLKILSTVPVSLPYGIAFYELVSTFIYFLLSLYVLLKVRVSYGVFMLLTLSIATFTGTFQSMPRYILHLFPGFIALALLTKRSKLLFYGTVVVFLILQIIFVSMFTRGYFVA